MKTRPAQLITDLGLAPHPEGGHFRETHRSPWTVRPDGASGLRSAITAIWFLLCDGERSRWHRLASDELWHFCEGDALDLFTIEPGIAPRIERCRLGPAAESAEPVLVVPAGSWQAARGTGAYTLASCTVAPGFEFTDFTLLADVPSEVARLRAAGAAIDDLL
jgi:hypothetical protein